MIQAVPTATETIAEPAAKKSSVLTEDAVMRAESSPHIAARRAIATVLAPQKARRYIPARRKDPDESA
eukprot:CAMPEP_0172202762 /NCGR_PEP_ID=MMETSP1050-20130122/30860_1 /TAXON_ID=233186 /ORGANISM="Cryptomonas curvata, Strain CCAP979/52" /LENGTH=67 /DNA_ID=CAMNT_0012880805 /DNA_START=66 /DNA_END=266 /DNA_ORIENTATION=+